MRTASYNINYINRFNKDFQRVFKQFIAQKSAYELIVNKLRMPHKPPSREADVAHNHFLKLIYNHYLIKLVLNGNLIIHSVKESNYIAYALAGRSLIEHVAVWRYYLVEKYAPIFSSAKVIDFEEMLALIKMHKKHLYGTSFDWGRWLKKDYSGLENDYLSKIKGKKNKQFNKESRENAQVNVLTCVEKSAKIEPKIGVYYDMFCDLVHPNFGSNILLFSISNENEIVIDNQASQRIGDKLIEETFKDLFLITYGQINELTKSLFSMFLGEEGLPSFVMMKIR